MQTTARRGRAFVIVGVVAGVLALTSCTGTEAARQRSAQAWLHATADRVADPDGWDSGGGQLLKDGDVAVGGLLSASTPAGDYEVLAVCRDAGEVRVTVRVVPRGTDRGDGAVAGAADLTCGRTVRIPVTVPARSGVWVQARTSADDEYALWFSTIATPGWTPSGPTDTSARR